VRQQPAGDQFRRFRVSLRAHTTWSSLPVGIHEPGADGHVGFAGQQPVRPRHEGRYPEGLVPQGISAELIAARWGFSRTDLDEFSAASHEKRRRGRPRKGLFDNELAPIAG